MWQLKRVSRRHLSCQTGLVLVSWSKLFASGQNDWYRNGRTKFANAEPCDLRRGTPGAWIWRKRRSLPSPLSHEGKESGCGIAPAAFAGVLASRLPVRLGQSLCVRSRFARTRRSRHGNLRNPYVFCRLHSPQLRFKAEISMWLPAMRRGEDKACVMMRMKSEIAGEQSLGHAAAAMDAPATAKAMPSFSTLTCSVCGRSVVADWACWTVRQGHVVERGAPIIATAMSQ